MLKRGFWILLWAAAAALLSSVVPRQVVARYGDIMGCEQSCVVAAGGWPFAYAVDYPGLSVGGRADALEVLLGEDRLWMASFALTFAYWVVMVAAVVALAALLKATLPRRRIR